VAEKDTSDNSDLLKRIRQRYRYGVDKWDRNRKEGQKNMKYVSGDPWDDEDKKTREGRPTVCPDELNQYVNQVVNTARQNPRGIKVDPAGDQATDKLAEYRENRIRAIEYACNASQVYVNGLQAAVERNIGYWKVTRAYVSDESDEQEIVLLPVMNPDSVLIDPDFKELDGSDIKWAFELDRIPLADFETEYPDAQKVSFSAEDFGPDYSSDWYDGKTILTASYWEVKQTAKKVGKKQRTAYQRTITQYVTNGVEILKKGAVQPGPYIPIIPVFGKELWVDYGGGAERVLLSLVTLARDPQKALAYVMSNMLENCGQIPKASWVGYVGQFETDKLAWGTSNQDYHPFLQADPTIDAATGQLLPLPQRTNLAPDFGAYSIGADICRRAIQAAMGIAPLPTAAQRSNQKSGVAIQKVQSEQAIGSYHLVDAYERAIKLTGRIVNNWLAEVDLGETQKPIRLADGKHQLAKINTDQPVTTESGDTYHFPIADDKGRYQVTISTGPSSDSQRDDARDFISQSLVPNLKTLPIGPQQAAEMLAISIRMMQLGPLGDQMADLISPQNGQQDQKMAQMQQQQGQMQEQMQKMQELLQKMQLEKAGKVIEMQGKMQLAQQDAQVRLTEANLDRETKLAVAEVGTKAQIASERQGMVGELEQQFHDQAHDVALQKDQQAHEQQLAAQQHQQALQQGQQQAANQSQQSSQEAAQGSQQSAQDAQQSQDAQAQQQAAANDSAASA
jgi:hypothetical protein